MHPFLTVIRAGELERPLGSYGAMMALGIFVVGLIAVRAAARARLDVGATFAVLACTVGGGFASAWTTFVIVEAARTGTFDAIRIAVQSGGGMVALGAVPGALASALAAGRWLRLPVLRLLDLSIPGVAAAHAMGRLGCLLGGCCFGAPSSLPWAIVYTHPFAPASHPPVPRHPTPVYEALAQLVLALVFALVPARHPGTGARAASYLGAYAIVRLLVETTRGDAVRGVFFDGALSTSQLLSIVALAVSLLVYLRLRFYSGSVGSMPQSSR